MVEAFPELVADVESLPGDFALDGELVVLDDEGKPQFEKLCARAWTRDAMQIRLVSRVQPAAIFCFDLLHANDEDHRHFPLAVRKAALRGLLRGGKRVRIAEHVEEQGQALYEHAKALDLEGVVGKRATSIYRTGRTNDWLKIKTPGGKAREASRMEHRHGR
jgi:bifunctional non-homologous end joining protein LigD